MSEPFILDGKALAAELQGDLSKRVEKIKEKTGITPILATILVGDNPSSETYVKMKGNACKRVGLESLKIVMSENTTTDELLNTIDELNSNPAVHGILLQHPVPRQIDEQKCFNRISLEKDVDGVNTNTFEIGRAHV